MPDFLRGLLNQHSADLAEFWPTGGPCWDGLARLKDDCGDPTFLLVEAKSYPDEANSVMGAKAESSIARINRSLSATTSWLGLNEVPPIWTAGRYQAANRLAHLYFLKERCRLNAALVFVCFIDDPTHGPHQATGADVWMTASDRLWADMCLAGVPSNSYVIYLPGLDVRETESRHEGKHI